jgi:hypothetical protein
MAAAGYCAVGGRKPNRLVLFRDGSVPGGTRNAVCTGVGLETVGS